MIIDDIRAAGVSVSIGESKNTYHISMRKPSNCNHCAYPKVSRKGYSSPRKVVEIVDESIQTIYIVSNRFFCPVCKQYVLSDDKKAIDQVLAPDCKFTPAVRDYVVGKMIMDPSLKYNHWEKDGISKSMVAIWLSETLDKVRTYVCGITPCWQLFFHPFIYEEKNRYAVFGTSDEFDVVLCDILDEKFQRNRFSKLMRSCTDLQEVYIYGDVYWCKKIKRLLEIYRILWSDQSAGQKIDDVAYVMADELVVDLVMAHAINAHYGTGIEIGSDGERILIVPEKRYSKDNIADYVKRELPRIISCRNVVPDVVRKSLEEVYVNITDVPELFTESIHELKYSAEYLLPIGFSNEDIVKKVMDQIDDFRIRRIPFEQMALRLLLNQPHVRVALKGTEFEDIVKEN